MSSAMRTEAGAKKPIDRMTRTEIVVELQSYQPAFAWQVITTEAFLERRAALWRRLDALNRLAPPPARRATR